MAGIKPATCLGFTIYAAPKTAGDLTNLSSDGILLVVSERPEYPLQISLNGRNLGRVVIDQHYRVNHDESMNDQIILDLIKTLDGKKIPPERTQGEFEYFTVEPVYRFEKPYRVVLVLCLTDDYLGVVNAFRVND
jgi:hypothetical protein